MPAPASQATNRATNRGRGAPIGRSHPSRPSVRTWEEIFSNLPHDDSDLASAKTEHQFLSLGLSIAKYDMWESYLPHCQIARFKEQCGVIPKTCELMWNDMRVSPEHKLPKNAKPEGFLLAMRFISTHDGETDLGQYFGIKSEKTVRDRCKIWVVRMRLLLAAKLGKFRDVDNHLIFRFSIDGTHCPIWEPRPFMTKWSSHKYGEKPAVNYELAIRLDVPKLMWVLLTQRLVSLG